MYKGFPAQLLPLVPCPDDLGSLELEPGAGPGGSIETGTVRCTLCRRPYRVERGILRLVDERALDAESAHEAKIRDGIVENGDYVEQFRSTRALADFDQMEMDPTLAAVGSVRDKVILELGAGTGRYTVELAKGSRALLAVDFSGRSLETLATKLEGTGAVGLIQADVSRFRVAPRSFDLVFSTLVSNLPTRAHRDATYALAASALRGDGAFVFSTHRYGVRQWARREPKDGRYTEGGIYRRLFTPREIVEEVGRYFQAPQSRSIQVALPLTYRLGIPLRAISRWAERLPLLNRLGFLLLVTARRPARALVVAAPPLRKTIGRRLAGVDARTAP
jgi:SAM-dependent methyltransferase